MHAARAEWPAPADWADTRDTLHLWTQVVGKVKLANTPLLPHWWNAGLSVTARGLTTGLMQHRGGAGFEITLDLCDHRLDISTTAGVHQMMPLAAGPVRDFYRATLRCLDDLGVSTEIRPMPAEIPGAIPLDLDDVHRSYHPEQAHRFWRALTMMVPVFERFRSRFLGKTSPVLLWWGGLDLAVSRFSGRTAPPYTRPIPNCGPQVMLEAYSHEVSSCGYWPGGGEEGMFYSYSYPEPAGYAAVPVMPAEAFWSAEAGEFLLPYESVRRAADPADALMSFLQSTYRAAAETADWDRARLERPSDREPITGRSLSG
jgi:Family of unknown function (DUF5996)